MKKIKMLSVLTLLLFVGLSSCKPKDSEIQENVNKVVSGGVTATVMKGVVTLTGEVQDESVITANEKAVSAVEGVKSVINACSVAAPEVVEPVVVEPKVNVELEMKVKDALKDFPGVEFVLHDGQIDLTGEISREKLVPLMQILQGMELKVNSKNLVKK